MPLTPDQQAELEGSLLEKYGSIQKQADDTFADAQKSARTQRGIAGLIDGFVGLANANNYARNGRVAKSSGGDILRDDADRSVSDASAARKAAVEQYLMKDKLGQQDKTRGMADARNKVLTDPNSKESQLAQSVAKKFAPDQDFSTMSAQQLETALPYLEKGYGVDAAAQAKKDLAQTQSDSRKAAAELNAANNATTLAAKAIEAQQAKEEERKYKEGLKAEENKKKDEEKIRMRTTPFGIARTDDDAKQLKAAGELKEDFDRKIGEMISLRESKGGGSVFDREAVARGKQLSKDLLLLYKDMAKLGVLSKSDEGILNTIIPSDPLEYNVSGLVGQDPTMVRLKAFRDDTNKQFQGRLKNRLESGLPEEMASSETIEEVKTALPKKKIVGKQFSKSTGKTRLQYDDGTTEIITEAVAGK